MLRHIQTQLRCSLLQRQITLIPLYHYTDMSKRKYSAFHGSAANMDNADGQAQVHKRARTRTRKRTPPLAPSSPSAPSAAAGNSLKGGQIASTTLKDVGGPGKGSYNGHQENRKGGRQGQGQQAPNRNTRISRGRISRPAQNKRQTDERPLMNEERIRREFTVPTRIDYPTAHASLFGSKMATTLHNLGGNVLRIRPEYISIGNSNLRCTLHYTPPNGSPENVVGEGLGKVNTNFHYSKLDTDSFAERCLKSSASSPHGQTP